MKFLYFTALHNIVLILNLRSSVTSSSPRQSVSPPKVAVKQSHGNKPDGMPPSYEEVTGTIKGQALYDSVPQETQHRYEEVPDISIDSSNIYEEIHVCALYFDFPLILKNITLN